jgi:hypothetical protein
MTIIAVFLKTEHYPVNKKKLHPNSMLINIAWKTFKFLTSSLRPAADDVR